MQLFWKLLDCVLDFYVFQHLLVFEVFFQQTETNLNTEALANGWL